MRAFMSSLIAMSAKLLATESTRTNRIHRAHLSLDLHLGVNAQVQDLGIFGLPTDLLNFWFRSELWV